MASAFQNLPWLNDSGQFLNAMIAGGRAGLEREQMAQRERLSDRQRSGRFNAEFVPPGGFPMAPQRIATPEPQEAPVIEEEAAPPNQPFQSFGKTWITNPAGNVVEYKAPAAQPDWKMASLSGGGIARVSPTTGQLETLFTPPSSATEKPRPMPIMKDRLGGTVTTPLTATEFNSQYDNLPEFARTNEIAKLVRGLSGIDDSKQGQVPFKSFSSDKEARESGLGKDDKVYIRGVGLVRLK
jgi:hypothetical protein